MASVEHTIAECWPSSQLYNYDAVNFASFVQRPLEHSIAVVVALILFVVFFKRHLLSITIALKAVAIKSAIKEAAGNQYHTNSLKFTSLLAFVLLFLMFLEMPLKTGFYTTLALMAGYVVLKWAFAGLAAWLQKGGELRSVVVVAERLFFILFVTLLIPIAFVTKINEGVTLHFFMIYSLVVFAACYLLFLFREREFFLEYRTSFFYWILYLCTLELLPTGVFLSIII